MRPSFPRSLLPPSLPFFHQPFHSHKFRLSPAASPEILHHTGWRTGWRMYSKVPDETAHCGWLPSSLPSAHRRRLLPATKSDPSMHTYRMSAPPAEVTTVWRGGLRMTSSMMERQVFFLWPNTAINYERKELFGRDHGHNTFTAKVINTKFILQHHQKCYITQNKELGFS